MLSRGLVDQAISLCEDTHPAVVGVDGSCASRRPVGGGGCRAPVGSAADRACRTISGTQSRC
jgi:hypothetical protein